MNPECGKPAKRTFSYYGEAVCQKCWDRVPYGPKYTYLRAKRERRNTEKYDFLRFGDLQLHPGLNSEQCHTWARIREAVGTNMPYPAGLIPVLIDIFGRRGRVMIEEREWFLERTG